MHTYFSCLSAHALSYACTLPLQCIAGLQDSQWLFPFKNLEFGEELGSGAFGVVRKARAYSLQPGEPATTVAVKMLKGERFSWSGSVDMHMRLPPHHYGPSTHTHIPVFHCDPV